jgi:succinate dehydrogenase/fumarate reductase cytochrome b subunit
MIKSIRLAIINLVALFFSVPFVFHGLTGIRLVWLATLCLIYAIIATGLTLRKPVGLWFNLAAFMIVIITSSGFKIGHF